MSYRSMGDIDPQNFTSTLIPGVCKPTNSKTLAVFKKLQTQLNRIAKVKGVPTVPVDGDIGGKSLALADKFRTEVSAYAGKNQDLGEATKIALTNTSSCQGLAMVADVWANECEAYADDMKAPTTVASPAPAKPPTYYDLSTNTLKEPSAAASLVDGLSTMSSGQKVVAAGFAVAVGFVLMGKKKRRR